MRIRAVAEKLGICSDTIRRWELKGVVPRARRDVRGWREYSDADISHLQEYLHNLHGRPDAD